MQLFVRIGGGDRIPVEVKPGDTIRAVIDKAGAPPGDERLTVTYSLGAMSKPIANLKATVDDYNLQAHTTLIVTILPGADSVGDSEVQKLLQQFLRICAGELGPGEITFIGVGSYDHGHGEASIKRQQCPDALLTYCVRNGCDLNIILIDSGFGSQQEKPSQIYHLGGWVLTAEEHKGRIRQYMYAPAAAARACDIWLTVFATDIPEYANQLSGQGKTIATIHLPSTFSMLGSSQHARSCLICGNFYTTDSSQYFTLGSKAAIEGAGFKVNP